MSKIKGTVSRTGEGKFSKYIMLEERDGFYFNTKFEPKCGKGDVVGIEYEQKGEARGNIKKIVVIEDNGGAQAKEAWSASEVSDYKAALPAGGNRQDSIVWQSSRKDALVLAGLLVSAAIFKPKGAADAQRVQVEELVDEITFGYFNAASDPRNSEAFKSNTVIEEDAAEPEAPKEASADDDWGSDDWED
jgi:hypothetical protein